MIIPDKKKAITVILERMKHPKEGEAGGILSKQEEVDYMPKDAHASAMIEAMHNKDPKKLVEAMNNFLEEHELHQDQEVTESSDYKPEGR